LRCTRNIWLVEYLNGNLIGPETTPGDMTVAVEIDAVEIAAHKFMRGQVNTAFIRSHVFIGYMYIQFK
jgi:hypothetical protein